MRHSNRHAERGTVMLIVVLMGALFFGLATFAGSMAQSGHETARREQDNVRARLAADVALSMALEEIQTGVDTYGGGLGVINQTTGDTSFLTTYVPLGGNLYQVNATARNTRARAGVTAVIQQTPTVTINFSPRAAITTKGAVTTTGSIEVDGRDWNSTGTSIVGPGKFGISSMSTITNSGNSKVGGVGIAPAKPVPAAVKDPNNIWKDNINNDGDGATDEEAYDGIDNDNDGQTDEDTTGYPTSPDVSLGLPVGTLKAQAIAQGTYFTTEAALNAAIAANGGVVPGGKILYLDFDQWLPSNMGSVYNDPPSIIVHHNTAGTAYLKNMHGSFKGLILADFVEHLNGDCSILGAFMSFGSQAIGNTFGNGNAHIRFSSSVLTNLPSAGSTISVRIVSRGRTVGAT